MKKYTSENASDMGAICLALQETGYMLPTKSCDGACCLRAFARALYAETDDLFVHFVCNRHFMSAHGMKHYFADNVAAFTQRETELEGRRMRAIYRLCRMGLVDRICGWNSEARAYRTNYFLHQDRPGDRTLSNMDTEGIQAAISARVAARASSE